MIFSVFTGHFIELITLFVIVFIHELGHVAAAYLFGIRVISIQMLPFGGVAIMDDTSKLTVLREIVIALAGPFQNAVMIASALVLRSFGVGDAAFLDYIIQGNMMIALFNLLPILPLDGGKVIQALISTVLPYHKTLLWNGRISVLFSTLVILNAVRPLLFEQGMVQLNLLMIGIFLLYSNVIDYRNVPYRFFRFLMNRDTVFARHLQEGALAQPIIADAAKPLEGIMRLFMREKYHLIYIMNNRGQILTVLPEQKIIDSFFAANRKP